jgi:isoquinoline 1-oxidoreductase subunit alpha
MAITIEVNGEPQTVDVAPDTPLLWALRDVIGLTGTKFGCGIAQCGACTVHIDGEPVRSCLLPVGSIGERKVTTVEGIGVTEAGRKIQKAWLDLEVVQCGYCQSGQIMSATALLAKTPRAERRRHRRGDGRKHLPVRDLRAHPRRDQASGAFGLREVCP